MAAMMVDRLEGALLLVEAFAMASQRVSAREGMVVHRTDGGDDHPCVHVAGCTTPEI